MKPFRTGLGLLGALTLSFAAGAQEEGKLAEKKTFEANVPIRAVTAGPKAHWFGYYDKDQFDPTGRYLLGMEVDFEDRPPRADDTITLGYVDLKESDKWTPFAQSNSWGWQQGCMLQWLPGTSTKVIYNTRQADHYVAVIQDVFTGAQRTLPKPIYAVSPDGKWAVTTNFSRIDETRPGYGYEGVADPYRGELHPANDGVHALDLETGEARLLFSYDQIAKFEPAKETGGKHWFNHLLVNTDGSRFIFLHRWKVDAQSPRWGTRMFTAGLDGSDLFCVSDHGMVSHFIWKNPEQILAWAKEPDGTHFWRYTDQTDEKALIGEGVLKHDGHCTYSPGGEWILTDGYPGADRMQPLMLYRPSDGELVELGRFYQSRPAEAQLRCDLHPRWNRDGSAICIDSKHMNDQRQIYVLDVTAITKP